MVRRTRPRRPEPTSRRAVLPGVGPTAADLVVISARGGAGLANALARSYPSATVHLLTSRRLPAARASRLRSNVSHATCATVGARLAYLARVRQAQAILDSPIRALGETGSRPFVSCSGWWPPGGATSSRRRSRSTVCPRRPPEQDRLAELLAELAAIADRVPVGEPDFTAELGMSTSGIERVDGRWIVSKRCAHQWKLRDRRANAILDRRFGPAWGEVIAHKPALGSPSRSRAEVHGESFRPLPETISVPDRWLRRYRSPVCYARKRVRLGEFWLF